MSADAMCVCLDSKTIKIIKTTQKRACHALRTANDKLRQNTTEDSKSWSPKKERCQTQQSQANTMTYSVNYISLLDLNIGWTNNRTIKRK